MKYFWLIFLFDIVSLAVFADISGYETICTAPISFDCPATYFGPLCLMNVTGNSLLLQNSCQEFNINCPRYLNHLDVLPIIAREECRKSCIECSEAVKMDICVNTGDQYCTVGSECELERMRCKSGIYWSWVLWEDCENNNGTSPCLVED